MKQFTDSQSLNPGLVSIKCESSCLSGAAGHNTNGKHAFLCYKRLPENEEK